MNRDVFNNILFVGIIVIGDVNIFFTAHVTVSISCKTPKSNNGEKQEICPIEVHGGGSDNQKS